MASPDSPQLETLVEKIGRSIAEARGGIDAELAKGGNPWLACFSTRAGTIAMLLGLDRARSDFGEERHQAVQAKLGTLNERLAELKLQYRMDRDVPLPDAIKKELLGMLDELMR